MAESEPRTTHEEETTHEEGSGAAALSAALVAILKGDEAQFEASFGEAKRGDISPKQAINYASDLGKVAELSREYISEHSTDESGKTAIDRFGASLKIFCWLKWQNLEKQLC